MSDNAKLQKLIDTGGLIPYGTYNIDADKPLLAKSGATLRLTGVTLAAIPNAAEHYNVLLLRGNDITVFGGVIVGERKQHKGSTGEWGHGIRVKEATRVHLLGVECRDCWGDGFYVGNNSSDITIEKCVSTGNRRQGLSITGVDKMFITGSTFQDTGGTRPGDGIDIEPDKGGTVTGVTILNNTFKRNEGSHVHIVHSNGTVRRIIVMGNTFDGTTIPVKVQHANISLWTKMLALWGDYSGYAKEVQFRV